VRVGWGWIPAGVILAAALGVGASRLAVVPSFERDFEPAGRAELARSILVVKGLKCVDTAQRVGGQLEGVKGVKRFVAFASQHRADISYDPALVTPEALVDAIEGPVYDKGTGMITFGDFKVLEVDGKKVSR
jgi:copper chaperone CopZ